MATLDPLRLVDLLLEASAWAEWFELVTVSAISDDLC